MDGLYANMLDIICLNDDCIWSCNLSFIIDCCDEVRVFMKLLIDLFRVFCISGNIDGVLVPDTKFSSSLGLHTIS